ncbi:hypothetical protein KGF56_002861 [Candida oxycetoniae]|uniref:Uncharacterized protein n=1 Tax=Candida oxycetoniae TaxID=497107 RepID=A0AAI9SX47_9ASCO|nr:uncharacterized protein KGF56_002861 [Candida oxycetoniae]KAI3404341.2 hypothetical protein KGF56_002861 [Candida oxycetoniae]
MSVANDNSLKSRSRSPVASRSPRKYRSRSPDTTPYRQIQQDINTIERSASMKPYGRAEYKTTEPDMIERGRTRSREDRQMYMNENGTEISLMGFKTGSKHKSPAKDRQSGQTES